MRLSQLEKDVLIANAIGQFGSQTALYLFGSRVNDQSKGGDIDVLIVPGNNMNASNLYHKKIQFLVKIKSSIEDQKIDVIVKNPNDNRNIIETAIKEGIRLC